MMAPYIFDTDLTSFEHDVIEASDNHPILVDFWAEWCAPCLTIAPVLESVVPSYQGGLYLARLEVDEGDNMKLAGKYQVRGFPTIMLFMAGKEIDRFSGARPAQAIHTFIQQQAHLSAPPN